VRGKKLLREILGSGKILDSEERMRILFAGKFLRQFFKNNFFFQFFNSRYFFFILLNFERRKSFDFLNG
jgi:hypothetical protein